MENIPETSNMWEASDSLLLRYQRLKLEKLLLLRKRHSIDVNLHAFNSKLVSLRSLCSCRHGNRTVGCCAHRIGSLWLLYRLWTKGSLKTKRRLSHAAGAQQLNIETWTNYKLPADPATPTDTEAETSEESESDNPPTGFDNDNEEEPAAGNNNVCYQQT